VIGVAATPTAFSIWGYIMRRSFLGLLVVGALFTAIGAIASADDAQDKAIKKDRKQTEGTWRVVTLEVNGDKLKDEFANQYTVVNGSDGTWSLLSKGKELNKGTSTIDPTKKPKTLDFTVTEGEGKGGQFLGIYELGEKTRKMCFAESGKARPTDFTSTPENKHYLVTFEREKAK
jgi:uncharacterized protein (TIGR03067 family)